MEVRSRASKDIKVDQKKTLRPCLTSSIHFRVFFHEKQRRVTHVGFVEDNPDLVLIPLQRRHCLLHLVANVCLVGVEEQQDQVALLRKLADHLVFTRQPTAI